MDKFLHSALASKATSPPTPTEAPLKDPTTCLEEITDQSRKRKIVRTSEVWDHFTNKKGCDPKNSKALCNYCGQEFSSSSSIGTSSMLKHLKDRCKSDKNPHRVGDKNKKQKLLSFPQTNEDGVNSNLLAIGYSKEVCREALAKMVIKDELSFRTVEGDGFRHFCRVMQPKFVVPSRVTVARDILRLFEEERAKLKIDMRKNCVRVCLTTDGWTSLQNIHYMVLTAHYIDSEWVLRKKILNFCTMPSQKGESIGKLIEQCMQSWGLEKVFTVTVDNASANDTAISFLKRRANGWKGTVLEGEFVHVRCVAHILNLIVSEGLKKMHQSVAAIRNVVRYVRISSTRLGKFMECVEVEKIDYKGRLKLDVATRWNSTYTMLDVALKVQKAFERYEEEDDKYVEHFVDGIIGPPAKEDWENAKVFVKFLKSFYEITLKVSASLHVTSNTYFHVSIMRQLNELSKCEDNLLSNMVVGMKTKLNKYWGDVDGINCLLFVAIVLDPRYKLDYVKYCWRMIYDSKASEKLSGKIEATLRRLLDFYGETCEEKDGGVVENVKEGCLPRR